MFSLARSPKKSPAFAGLSRPQKTLPAAIAAMRVPVAAAVVAVAISAIRERTDGHRGGRGSVVVRGRVVVRRCRRVVRRCRRVVRRRGRVVAARLGRGGPPLPLIGTPGNRGTPGAAPGSAA